MHDLVLLFKYKTGTVTSNFGRLIQTATRHYRIRNFHQTNSRNIRNIIVTAFFLGLLSCGTAYLIYLSLARISRGLESILTITSEVYSKLIVRHDLSIILHTFFS